MPYTKNPEVKYTQLFIDGEYVNAVKGGTFSVVNPSTEKEICKVQEGTKEDIDLAVAAAERAFAFDAPWRTMDASNRGLLLLKLADLVEENAEYLASLESVDCGKTPASASGDMGIAIKNLRYFGGIADKLEGVVAPSDGQVFAMTIKQPVGVVGGIVPWNYPFHLTILKLAPALAAGCTLVIKPAEQTPLTGLLIGEYCNKVGIPKGVVNVVPGFGHTAGAALSLHPKVDKISFTGSTEVGRIIMKAAADTNLKRVTLELGGKSPIIVCADCPDMEYTSRFVHEMAIVNHGQCCIAGTRTFVEASIYDKFVELMAKYSKEKLAKVGDPFDAATEQGPQIDATQTDKILDLIESGKREGARLVCGGNRMKREGYFIEPTVFADVKDDMRIAKEEIFGPVQSVFKFTTLEEAITRANNTNYGLGAAIFTTNVDKALSSAKRLLAGCVYVNTYLEGMPQVPFGGFKESGIGREMGSNGCEGYLETKTIAIKVTNKIS